VHVGQEAQIKLVVYAFQKYGMATGKVIHVSADFTEVRGPTELGKASGPADATHDDSGALTGGSIYNARLRLDTQVLRDPLNSVSGAMLRGDFLYVKWRNVDTYQVYEDTVDLRSRLPRDIEGQRVYFMIRGSQLYVYLISRESKPPDMPAIGPRMYRDRKVIQVYPDKE
jgi:hypothetical protein